MRQLLLPSFGLFLLLRNILYFAWRLYRRGVAAVADKGRLS